MSARILIALTSAALLAACSPGIGDFCFEDSDCKAGLRCSSQSGERGICTYPEGAADLALKPDRGKDQGLPDQGADQGTDLGSPDEGVDQGTDLAPDLPPADQAAPDVGAPDQSPPDLSPADAGGADGSSG